jgi:hypothetical protein
VVDVRAGFSDIGIMTDEVAESARELVERRGEQAIDWLHERIRLLQEQGEVRSLDVTYRVLSEVERLLSEKRTS